MKSTRHRRHQPGALANRSAVLMLLRVSALYNNSKVKSLGIFWLIWLIRILGSQPVSLRAARLPVPWSTGNRPVDILPRQVD